VPLGKALGAGIGSEEDGRAASGTMNAAPATSWMLGNPEVIRKQAPGNRSDGFRLCLTRYASSSVAWPENCRPTLRTLGISEQKLAIAKFTLDIAR